MRFISLSATLSALLTLSLPGTAQVTLDGSMGHAGPILPLNNSVYEIFANDGQIRGHNLFESFGLFNIDAGQAAIFFGPANPGSIDNLIIRVTGGQSIIDGVLTSTMPLANVWLIDPNGLVFGSHAAINTAGSLYVSTADYLKFTDGTLLETHFNSHPLLTAATPEAFGFLGTNSPATIDFKGTAMATGIGKTFAAVAGDININAGNYDANTIHGTYLQASSGNIDLASMAGNGEVGISNNNLQIDKSASLGTITINQQSTLDISGSGGGNIVIRTGNLTVDNANLNSNTSGNTNGAAIDIQVQQKLNVINNSTISDAVTQANSTANLGVIAISAKDATIESSKIIDQTLGQGNAGDINLTVGNLLLDQYSSLQSVNYSLDNKGNVIGSGNGSSGTVSVVATDTINVNNDSYISTGTASSGNAGEISLKADQVQVANTSFLGSSSFSETQGSAGQLNIQANTLSISEAGAAFVENINGQGGLINISVQHLDLAAGGIISTSTYGSGTGGNITIKPAQDVDINGISNNIQFQLPDGRWVSGQASGIYLNTVDSGNGGTLQMQTQQLQVTDGGLISAIAAFGSTATAKAGDLNINTGSAVISGGGLISTATSGVGSAGNINLTATGPISISGQFDPNQHLGVTNPRISDNSGINSSGSFKLDNRTATLGAAGSITVNADNLSLSNGAEISVANPGLGSNSLGGSITLNAGNSFYSQNADISAQTASAVGGDIILNAGNTAHLINSSISTSVAGGKGSGGNIDINHPEFVILDNSQITAQAQQGAGGNIHIGTGEFIPSATSLVSASSAYGVNGTVIITSPDTNILGKTTVLTANFLDTAALFKQPCETRYADGFSSLALRLNNTLPPAPGETLYQLSYHQPVSVISTDFCFKNHDE